MDTTPQSGPERVVRRSRRSRSQTVIFLNFLISCVVLAVAVGGIALYLGKREFDAPGPLAKTDVVFVKPNTGVADIAQELERRGMITNASLFRGGVSAYGAQAALKAGEYEVKAGASMRDIMELLRSGKSVQHRLTIPEGWTVEQAFQRIAADEALAGEMPAVMPPEGSLVADTLPFTRGQTRQQVVEKMIADQKKLVDGIWARRQEGLPVKDVNEFVTLASIVEKETGVAAERPRVAAVFVNRLRQGMRLQSDPTIIYGLFGGKGKPSDRPIYQSDVAKPTPYNTYVIKGLPPTPIANPGRAALEAVANPATTSEIYFVADGSGGHVFAQTLEEHNRNVAEWRKIEKQAEEADKARRRLRSDRRTGRGAGSMSLQSMTGFGRSSGSADGATFAWELRSVNGKGLEIRVRLPVGLDAIEPTVRQSLQRRFTRGNIQATLSVTRETATASPAIDTALLEQLAALSRQLQERFGCAPATAGELLSLPGVLSTPSARDSEEAAARLASAALAAFELAGDALAASRTAEGAALFPVFSAQLHQIAALAAAAEADPSREPAIIRLRLAEQIAQLLGTGAALDEQRLHMEAALLATKADIREELDRLTTHVAAARALLVAGGPVGRRLDFLAQEFNRESNTLCSKSNASTVTAIGLEAKVVVDQFREQIQNLE